MNNLIHKQAATAPHERPTNGNQQINNISPKRTIILNLLKKHGFTLSIILFVFLLGACLFLLNDAVNVGAKALANSYDTAYGIEKEAAYEELYQNSYDRAEAKYHVSGRVLINIDGIEKTGRLEVLEANHVEFITKNRDDSTDNITAWIEVSGKGTFIVDLKAAEFIVDNEHRYVLVRIPNPELVDVSITNAVEKLFKDDIWNGSYSDGVNLAVDQFNDANVRIKKALMSDPYIYMNAKTVAVSIITNLVKELNSNIQGLTVEVEFVD